MTDSVAYRLKATQLERDGFDVNRIYTQDIPIALSEIGLFHRSTSYYAGETDLSRDEIIEHIKKKVPVMIDYQKKLEIIAKKAA